MMRARLLLATSALLFTAWICWLGYLAFSRGQFDFGPVHFDHRPIVLSRPQFLASTCDVIARVGETPGPVEITDVHYCSGPEKIAPNQSIEIEQDLSKLEGWNGTGKYILPLVRDGKKYAVARIPQSPGYGGGAPRIYPAETNTIRQLEHIPKSQGSEAPN